MATRETPVQIHRFNVEAYHRLIEAGVLHEDDKVELIEGRIIDKPPIGSQHAACVNRLNNLLTQMLQGKAIVSVQDPIRLDQHSEPEPDIALLKHREDFYADRLPQAEEALLVIEVANTSLEYDREAKVPTYAKAGIQETWLVNLLENCIEVYQSPSAEGYEMRRIARHDSSLSPQAFPDLRITANEILGG
jgi:Uma2 family endonuclease